MKLCEFFLDKRVLTHKKHIFTDLLVQNVGLIQGLNPFLH